MPTLNINGNIRTNTAAGWGADATVYTAKTILVTTDAYWGSTDQRKFKIADGVQTWSNLDYFPVSGYDDATSSIQTQLNGKQATLTNPVTGTGTNNEIAYFNATGSTIASLSTGTYPSLTELSYVKGATSSIQTQLNAKYRSEQFFTTSNQSVADGGVYIFGQTGAPANTAASASKVPVLAGTVVAVTTEVFSASTIGSTEGGTLKLWYNDGAASLTLATDFQVSANRSFFRAFTGLSTAINDGNCYIEYTAPTLATNPTAIRWMVTVYIK